MLGCTRIGDIGCGVCFCHDSPIGTCGILIPSQNTVFFDNRNAIRLGDILITFCGHVSVVVTSSSLTITEYINQTRLTDVVVGCMVGTVVTSSTTVFTD